MGRRFLGGDRSHSRSRRWRIRMQALGRCAQCGRRATLYRCKQCRERAATDAREHRAFLRAHGLTSRKRSAA